MDMMTYISLFSSAGVGCYGFKIEGFECIATNEIVERRLNVQKFNKKCKYDSGYILGDITDISIQNQLFNEISLWKNKESLDRVDVVIATPPCQGMSVANLKKTNNEIIRNSLVVESIKIIKKVNPRFFVFENVPAFMKTICTDVDGVDKPISQAIQENLGTAYSYVSKVINFKDYGACSSRQRTLVIGVANDYADQVSPFELYPPVVKEKTLREVIGSLKPLKELGEIDENDIYHSFRAYPEHMRSWIAGLKEGESAFDNIDDSMKPHQVIDGKIVINKQKTHDKYKRQYWNKVGPCIHTRNDQLASQNTIHPFDDRVFSIRELMLMMTVPNTFKWSDSDDSSINCWPLQKKKAYLKKEEIKIRQSLGEAVPTVIFQEIAKKIKEVLSLRPLKAIQVKRIVDDYNLNSVDSIISFIKENPLGLSIATIMSVAEFANAKRTVNAAYFTSKSLITEILKNIPDIAGNEINVLEPSVGVGNFIPLIISKFNTVKVNLDVMDIDPDILEVLKVILKSMQLPDNISINFLVDDFLTHKFDKRYNYIIGNPPFFKLPSNDSRLDMYRKDAVNKDTRNICSFFLEKSLNISDYVALVFPKFLLNTPEFATSRQYLQSKTIDCIIDFGEKGFPGVLVETICIMINNLSKPNTTKVISFTHNVSLFQSQKYICDNQYPYWLIYRNTLFDSVAERLTFDVFTVFRDRQITKSVLSSKGDIRVLKARNISDNGDKIIDIDDYDSFISKDIAERLAVYAFYNKNVYITPNMTYKPRVSIKPKGTLVNGSVAILMPKFEGKISKEQMLFFSSDEYRQFYQIARNYQTRSLNVDACSVFFYGLLKQ